MANKRAQTLEGDQVGRLIRHAESKDAIPESARLCILLSFKAGLRAAEIAKLRVRDLTDASGEPSQTIRIFSGVGKGGKERSIPMHREIREAFVEFRNAHPRAEHVALGRRGRRPPYVRTPNALTAWFHRLFATAGFRGCSSHSGRRTFATNLARDCHRYGKTLVHVQDLLGHAQLNTTEAYLDRSGNVFDLVNSL